MMINRSEIDHDPASTLTLTDELARALRNLMSMNGEPRRNDRASPGYHYDRDLFETHAAAWRHAKQALEWYDRTQSE
jgi:hypothetical protein